MDINAIILILVGVGVVYFAIRFVSKTVKWVIHIFLLIILILALLTVLVYKDVNDLKKGFAENNNTFFLYENSQLYTAITLKPLINSSLTLDSFGYFTEEEINKSQESINNKDYETLLKNNYKIFILKPAVINRPYTLDIGITLNEGDLLNIIMSSEPYLTLAQKAQEKYNMSSDILKESLEEFYGNAERFKGYLFAALLSNYFQQQGQGELVRNIKEKSIIIYPESISFKIIKYLPWA